MIWIVLTILASWGLWVWRQRNAFRLRAYLLEQKYIHHRAVDAAMNAQFARDRVHLTAVGGRRWATDLLGHREISNELERQVRILQAAHVAASECRETHVLFPPYTRGRRHAEHGGH